DWAGKTTTPFGAATIQSLERLISLQEEQIAEEAIASHLETIRQVLLSFVAAAVLMAGVIAFFITRSIVTPLGQLVAMTDAISKGDFTRRLKLDRDDEFGALYGGFNKMIEELTRLVGEMQTSGIQVDTSVNEIAATAKQQQATASEVAATTTEI